MLNARNEWSTVDGNFDAEQFFLDIVALFEDDPTSDWAIQTLDWWDQYAKCSVFIVT